MADCLSDEDMATLIYLYPEEENLHNYRCKEYHHWDRARKLLRAMGKNWDGNIVCILLHNCSTSHRSHVRKHALVTKRQLYVKFPSIMRQSI